MKQPSKIVFADDSLKKAFLKLQEGTSEEKRLYADLARAFEEMEKDSSVGIRIRNELIPKEYVRKYGIDNLWKYDLPDGWRLVYSIEKDELMVISIVLAWFDHQRYERVFNY